MQKIKIREIGLWPGMKKGSLYVDEAGGTKLALGAFGHPPPRKLLIITVIIEGALVIVS